MTEAKVLAGYFNIKHPLGPDRIDPGTELINELWSQSNLAHKQLFKKPLFIIGRKGSGKTSALMHAEISGEYEFIIKLPQDHVFPIVLRRITSSIDSFTTVENVAKLWEFCLFNVVIAKIFDEFDKIKVRISNSAYKDLYSHIQFDPTSKEAGGLLLGRDLYNSNSLIIDKVTFPFPEENRSRFHCYRGEKHMTVAKKYWKAESKTGQILGLWHTHPEQSPTPSQCDLNDWKKQLSSVKNTPELLFFLILGIEKMGVWYGRLGTTEIHELPFQLTRDINNGNYQVVN